jgi:endonuclease III
VNAAKRKLSARAGKIVATLHATYPDAHCALHYDNPLQLLIATILSAQCTDARVNQVTPALFTKYRTAADFTAAPPGELENLIRSTGFFRNKARAIRSCCRAIAAEHAGRVPDAMPALLQLDGIGRKTASVVLGVAYRKAEGIVVDTHVARLSHRLGLTRQKAPEKIERALMAAVPRADWIDFSHLLIWHGRRRCTARKPDCIHCELCNVCPQIGVSP